MAYLIQLHALKELAAIGIFGSKRSWSSAEDVQNDSAFKELRAAADLLLRPISLAVTDDSDRLEVSVDFVAKEFVENHAYLMEYQVRAALNALVMAHEVTKSKDYRTTDEKWEFLRHCRNAAAHNGCWLFRKGEPKHPAKWRAIELSSAMHGQPLLIQANGTGSLNLGDPIALLWDIERDNPRIRVCDIQSSD